MLCIANPLPGISETSCDLLKKKTLEEIFDITTFAVT